MIKPFKDIESILRTIKFAIDNVEEAKCLLGKSRGKESENIKDLDQVVSSLRAFDKRFRERIPDTISEILKNPDG